jgi:hypothetical protein
MIENAQEVDDPAQDIIPLQVITITPGGQYNRNHPRPDYKKKYPNNRKFVKKEKVKGAATLDTDSDSDHEADKSDHNLDIESDTNAETIPHPIDDKKELRAKFK